jgi:hypothetical protein
VTSSDQPKGLEICQTHSRQTYPAPDITTTNELSRGSRRETTYTKDSTPFPKPDAPAPGVEPPNEGQAASLPKPKNLHLTEDHLRPAYESETRKEPPYRYSPYPYSYLALAQALQGNSLPHPFILLQKDHSLNHEQRAGVYASSLLSVAASQHITFNALFGAHFGPWPEHIGWLQACPLCKAVPPIGDASGHSSNRQSHLRTRILPLLLYFEQKLDHQRRGWGLPRPLRKVGHLT